MELIKRTEVYLQRPIEFEMSGCKCGNNNPDWSEFRGHLWCATCEIDFVPEQQGFVDGSPVGINAAHLMGLCFATMEIETGVVRPCDTRLCVAARANFR